VPAGPATAELPDAPATGSPDPTATDLVAVGPAGAPIDVAPGDTPTDADGSADTSGGDTSPTGSARSAPVADPAAGRAPDEPTADPHAARSADPTQGGTAPDDGTTPRAATAEPTTTDTADAEAVTAWSRSTASAPTVDDADVLAPPPPATSSLTDAAAAPTAPGGATTIAGADDPGRGAGPATPVPPRSPAATDAGRGAAEALRVADLVDAARATLRRGEPGSLRVELHPAELGGVRVEVRLDGGSVRVDLRPETAIGAERLSTQLAELRRGLERVGVPLERVELHQATDDAAGRSTGGGRGRDGERPDPSTPGTAGRVAPRRSRPDHTPGARPPMHPGRVALDL
jgi:flagellar hook-length control protein FliK